MGHNRRFALALLVAASALAIAATPAQAGKVAEATFGGPGSTGGLLQDPGDIAVNQATGQVYVAESGNRRISRFDSSGNFELAWGSDIVPGGSGNVSGNEQQQITVAAIGGTFTVELFEGRAPVPYDASAPTLRTALEADPKVAPGDVLVSGSVGGPWTVEFTGALANTDVPQIVANRSELQGVYPRPNNTPGGEAFVTTLVEGSGLEVCTVAAQCRAAGSVALAGPMAIDQSNGHVYVLASARITEYDANGGFIRAFGWDVVKPGGSGEVKGNERQRITLGVPLPVISGTFTLTLNPLSGSVAATTAPIPFDASAATVQAALEALPNVAPGDISVTGPAGGPWTLEYAGAFAGQNLSQPLIDTSALGGPSGEPGSGRIETLANGGGYEICSILSQCQAGASQGHDAGQIGSGGALAIAPAGSPVAGDLFLADRSHARVQQFGPDGTFKRAWGWGVDTGADQFELCTAASGCQVAVPPADCGFGCTPVPANGQFNANLTGGVVFGTGQQPTQIAVDAAGVVYASNGPPNGGAGMRIDRFDAAAPSPAGLLLPDPIGTANPPPGFPAGPLPSTLSRGFEVDPVSGYLYYLTGGSGATPGGVTEVDPSASEPFDAHMQGVESNVIVNGLGYAGLTDRLYVSVPQVDRILVVGNNGAPPPTLTVEPPAGVQAHQVTLKGTVTPNGPASIETSYRFEHTKAGEEDWTPVPAKAINLGDGSALVAVEQTATGLEACTDYEARLFAAKTFGAGTTISDPLPFKSLCIAPEAETLVPQRLTDTEATLAATLNPNNEGTTYRFEYVSEAEFGANGFANATAVPVPDGEEVGGTVRKVAEDIEGLESATAYRYRILATNASGTTAGGEVSFTTRPTPSASTGRAFEMVTPPFKSVRSAVKPGGAPGYNPNPGVPSLSGDSILWQVPYFPLTDEVGAPGSGDMRIIRRDPKAGWVSETVNTLPLISGSPLFVGRSLLAASADLETQPIDMFAGSILPEIGGLLPTEGAVANRLYTFRMGSGVEGYTPWLENPEEQYASLSGSSVDLAEYATPDESALLNDAGTAMVRWGPYRGLAEDPETPADEDPSDDGILGPKASIPYLQRASDPTQLPTAPKELVNECTGAPTLETQAVTMGATAGSFTLTLEGNTTASASFNTNANTLKGRIEALPNVGPGNVSVTKSGQTWTVTFSGELTGLDLAQISADSSALTGGSATVATLADGDFADVTVLPSRTADGKLAGRACPSAAFLTSVLGAAVGSASSELSSNPVEGPAATALADDGSRVFFTSPEPSQAPAACATAALSQTSCPPQLFVRQYDSEGNLSVRWISRAQGVGTQDIEEMGAGVGFQGASRDGRYVYFKTNAPLLPDDPNGGESIATGKASDLSWDLYRYELPESLDEDPADGTLTRISGGPDGSADSGTSCSGIGTNCESGNGAPLRFLSDDGTRAYFLTTSPIAGADSAPPTGGSTAPGGTVGNGGDTSGVRNLYLFDANESGAERYRFIAQLPFAMTGPGDPGALNTCASASDTLDYQLQSNGGTNIFPALGNCFRGTSDGSAVLFSTGGQLTADDNDSAGDLYLYDAEADELTRVSAPPAGAEPYVCNLLSSLAMGDCNADLGWAPADVFSGGFRSPEASRGWGGMRYENIARDSNGVLSVFFESRSELLPADQNGEGWDVYQWREGKLSLISRALPGHHSYFSGNSPDGQDVFIWTSDRIDPREVDPADYDLYDARVGGGFPPPPVQEPCDALGLGCERAAAPPPAPSPASTASFAGPGNPKARPTSCRKGQVKRKGRCVVKRRAKARGNKHNSRRSAR